MDSFKKDLWVVLNKQMEENVNNKSKDENEKKNIDLLLKKAEKFCLIDGFDKAKELYQMILDKDSSYIGLVKVASKDFTEYDEEAENAIRVHCRS